MKKCTILLTLLVLLISSTILFSQTIPQTINYQGVLKDAAGVVVTNGDYNITFKLYSTESGGTELWTETKLINVVDGIINTQLGSATPLNLPFDEAYWLGIIVSTGSELTPRIKLSSIPYSFMTMNVMDGSITTSKLQDGAVTTNKIFGDAGIEYNNIGSVSNISTTATNLGSLVMSCPTAGYVLLMLSGDAIFFGDQTVVEVGLSTTSSTINLNYARTGRLDGTGTLRYVNDFTALDIYPVNSGQYIFYGVALKENSFSANNVNLINLRLTGIFIPKRY